MQSSIKIFRQFISIRHLPQPSFQVAFVGLALVMLACGFAGIDSQSVSGRAVGLTPLPTLTRTRLPTFTPTASSNFNTIDTVMEPADSTATLVTGTVDTVAVSVASNTDPTSLPSAFPTPDEAAVVIDASAPTLPPPPTDAATATPADTPTILPTETPQPTDTFTPEPTSTPSPTATIPPAVDYDKWSFANIKTEADEDRLVIFGEVINDTGVAQELDVISGLFYDKEGEIIADDRNMETSWSFELIQPGERVSFEVIVDGIQEAADFELNVEAQPVGDS